MKRYLTKISIFCAIILALALVIDLLVSQGLRHTPKNHLETMNMVMHDTPRYDVLVLGNSRGACGYSTYILDSILHCNSFNISVSGKAFRISNLRYQAYRRNNPAPKLIIVNIDYIEMGEGTLGYENYMFYPYITDTLVKPVLEMNHFSCLDRYLPMYRYRGDYKYIGLGLCEFFNVYHLPARTDKGYYPNPNGTWDGVAMRSQIKETPHNIGVGVDSSVIKIFDTFLARTKKEGVNVIMVNSPLYFQIRENLSPKNDTLMMVYNNLSEKYDIPILDYQETSISYDSTYFRDGNHLCQIGAEVFTTQLAHDIDSLKLY